MEDFSQYTKGLKDAIQEGVFDTRESLDAFWFTFEESPEVLGELERLQASLNSILDGACLVWRIVDLVWDEGKLRCLVNVATVQDVFAVYAS